MPESSGQNYVQRLKHEFMAGTQVELMRILAAKMSFLPEFDYTVAPGGYTNGRWTGVDEKVGFQRMESTQHSSAISLRFWFTVNINCHPPRGEIGLEHLTEFCQPALRCLLIMILSLQVQDGRLAFLIGITTKGTDPRAFRDFGITCFLFDDPLRIGSRKPIPVATFGNLAQAFHPFVWGLVGATLTVFSLSFALAHRVYSKVRPQKDGLTGPLANPADFVLVPFTAFAEPDPIPWFPRASAGTHFAEAIAKQQFPPNRERPAVAVDCLLLLHGQLFPVQPPRQPHRRGVRETTQLHQGCGPAQQAPMGSQATIHFQVRRCLTGEVN